MLCKYQTSFTCQRKKKFQVNQLQITLSWFSSFIVLILKISIKKQRIIFILNKILKLPESQNKQGRGGVKTIVVINIHLCALQNITFLASIFTLAGKWETVINTKKLTRIHPKAQSNLKSYSPTIHHTFLSF